MKYFYLVLLSLFIFACEKDEPTKEITIPDPMFIKEVIEDGQTKVKYVYENDFISNRDFYKDGQLWFSEVFTYSDEIVNTDNYDVDGLLTSSRKYYSIDENISRRDRFDANGELNNYRLYTFSDEICGFISLDIYNNDDEVSTTSNFIYLDENCSMESNVFGSDQAIRYREEWIRDDKNLYNKHELLDFFRGDHLGNVISYSKWNNQNVVDIERSYTSTFEYNDANYPISEQRTFLDGTISSFIYEYY